MPASVPVTGAALVPRRRRKFGSFDLSMRWNDSPLPVGSICRSTTVVLTAFASAVGRPGERAGETVGEQKAHARLDPIDLHHLVAEVVDDLDRDHPVARAARRGGWSRCKGSTMPPRQSRLIIRIRSICSSAAVSLSRFRAAPQSSITRYRTSPLYCRPMKWQGKLASIFGGTDVANLFWAKQFPWPLPS